MIFLFKESRRFAFPTWREKYRRIGLRSSNMICHWINVWFSVFKNKTEESEHQIFELNEKLAHEKDLREAFERKLKEISENSTGIKNDEQNLAMSIEMEKMKSQIALLQKELFDEKHDSKVWVFQYWDFVIFYICNRFLLCKK